MLRQSRKCKKRVTTQQTKNSQTYVEVVHQNVGGLNTKVDTFYSDVLACGYNVIAITESWLNDSVSFSEFFAHNYAVYGANAGAKGRGVILAIDTKLSSKSLVDIT